LSDKAEEGAKSNKEELSNPAKTSRLLAFPLAAMGDATETETKKSESGFVGDPTGDVTTGDVTVGTTSGAGERDRGRDWPGAAASPLTVSERDETLGAISMQTMLSRSKRCRAWR
jgi:hypothetical protein